MVISGMKFIERIEAMGVQRKSISRDLGIPEQTISNWKTRDKAPKSEELFKIAKYLNVSMEWLLTGEERHDEIPADLLKFRDLSLLQTKSFLIFIMDRCL